MTVTVTTTDQANNACQSLTTKQVNRISKKQYPVCRKVTVQVFWCVPIVTTQCVVDHI